MQSDMCTLLHRWEARSRSGRCRFILTLPPGEEKNQRRRGAPYRPKGNGREEFMGRQTPTLRGDTPRPPEGP